MKKFKISISVYNSEADKFFSCSEVVEANDLKDARMKGGEAIERLKKENPARHCTIGQIAPQK